MKIENWSVINCPGSPYDPPELWIPRLHGKVYGHPRFEEGKDIATSRIVGIEGELLVTHSGSQYELGIVDPDYEKAYPDARKRLFKSLQAAA